jgi:predicted PurR-regulated permease PerM
MGDSRTTSDTPSSRLSTTASESSGLLRRLSTIGFFIAASAVFVVTLRLWCVVFAGLLLGVFLRRISQAIEQRTPLAYQPAVGCVLAAGVLLSIGAIYLVAPRFGEQLEDLSSTLRSSGTILSPCARPDRQQVKRRRGLARIVRTSKGHSNHAQFDLGAR